MNNENIDNLIKDTEELVATLKILNNEIESYDTAKKNLSEVKEKLEELISRTSEASVAMNLYIKEINSILSTDIINKLENVIRNTEENLSNLENNQRETNEKFYLIGQQYEYVQSLISSMQTLLDGNINLGFNDIKGSLIEYQKNTENFRAESMKKHNFILTITGVNAALILAVLVLNFI